MSYITLVRPMALLIKNNAARKAASPMKYKGSLIFVALDGRCLVPTREGMMPCPASIDSAKVTILAANKYSIISNLSNINH